MTERGKEETFQIGKRRKRGGNEGQDDRGKIKGAEMDRRAEEG